MPVSHSGRLAPKPPWFKVRVGAGESYAEVRATLGKLSLATVCQEARCPNQGECWSSGTATFLLLGPTCTRACRFCHVSPGSPPLVRPEEPERVAEAVKTLGLRYAVLTMVSRDDLDDGGAGHVASTIERVRRLGVRVEALVGDFRGNLAAVDRIVGAGPDVFGHNLEVVRRLGPSIRDRRSSYATSLDVLSHAKQAGARLTKSSLMLGLGETNEEVLEALEDLKCVNVDIVTLGQYSRPSAAHVPVERWVRPEEFAELDAAAHALGFAFVASGPLVRSSYRAAEAFVEAGSPA
jgi:lipoic acid synthetase